MPTPAYVRRDQARPATHFDACVLAGDDPVVWREPCVPIYHGPTGYRQCATFICQCLVAVGHERFCSGCALEGQRAALKYERDNYR